MQRDSSTPLFILIVIVVIILIRVFLKNQEFKRKQILLESDISNLNKKIDKLGQEKLNLETQKKILEQEKLKFQLQPHALRNIISTIYVASKNLFNGIESMADALDYILYKDNNGFSTIEDEVSFINHYKNLHSNFMTTVDNITLDTNEIDYNSHYYTQNCIPHLITAYFIENAFKHGDDRHKLFLNIKLVLKENYFELKMENRVKNHETSKEKGIGLKNMRKRLDLLVPGNYEIKHYRMEDTYYSYLKLKLDYE